MAGKKDLASVAPEEFQNEDFKFILQTLLDSYQPILEKELNRASSADELISAFSSAVNSRSLGSCPNNRRMQSQ